MKKYKHKITGTIAEDNNYFMCYAVKHERLGEIMIPREIIENSNDWEEVKVEYIGGPLVGVKEEPNYLITAFRDLRGGYATDIWKITSEGKYCKNKYAPVSLNHMINTVEYVNNGKFEIYSVKNSKGEFTLGEKVKTAKDVFTISKFEICGDDIIVRFKETLEHDGLELISKVKSPIYTTTDGIGVLEGDNITLFLLNKDLAPCIRNTTNVFGFTKQDKEVADRYLTFTSEENRDKYIKENTKKPVFVSADNVTFYDNNTDYSLFSVLPKANWQENRYRLNDIIKWPKKEWLHFHTKEARQEYIDTNKPKYSLADVFMASEKIPSGHLITTGMLDQLKKLGK